MQPPVPAPTAQGAFAKTPWPHLLVYALERRLSGTIDLVVRGHSMATILFSQGFPAKIRIADPILFLGDVLLELNLINRDQHAASIARLQESPRLHGQVLVEMGILDPQRVETGVRVQLERKLEHLFSLPADTVFAYFDGVDMLQRYGGPPTPIDPFPLLWRGVRQTPSWEHVDGTLRRVGSMSLRITPHAQLERFLLGRGEAAALDLLRQRPMRVVDLANAKVVGPSVAQLLIYTLVITKQVDIVDAASMRPPAGAQGGRSVPPSPPSSQPNPSGQAFARVQLQAKQVQRSPLVIAEEVATSATHRDERMSLAPDSPAPPSPEPVPPAADAPGGGLDIAGMIMSTIGNSMPPMAAAGPLPGSVPPDAPPSAPIPPAAASSAPNLPASPTSTGNLPAAPTSSGNLPAAPDSKPGLTAEQNALKAKILERAQQITGQNYFQMLGVEQDAAPEAIQKAFFGLAKIWHPDRLPPALVDVKDACSKVFTHITEAHATLSDQKRRQEYMTLLKEGGATPDDQAKIQAIIEAAQDFQKAEFHLKRNENDKAYELATKANAADPEQMDYLAMMTWLEAQQPQWASREKTLEKIATLDRCIKHNPNGERAYFWRGMLFKRIEENGKAIKDLKKAMELNPRNLDAAREVRLYNMRGGSKPPPGGGGGSLRPGKGPPQPEGLGGLFGKLFKK